MKTPLRTLATLSAASFLLAGCGGDDSSDIDYSIIDLSSYDTDKSVDDFSDDCKNLLYIQFSMVSADDTSHLDSAKSAAKLISGDVGKAAVRTTDKIAGLAKGDEVDQEKFLELFEDDEYMSDSDILQAYLNDDCGL